MPADENPLLFGVFGRQRLQRTASNKTRPPKQNSLCASVLRIVRAMHAQPSTAILPKTSIDTLYTFAYCTIPLFIRLLSRVLHVMRSCGTFFASLCPESGCHDPGTGDYDVVVPADVTPGAFSLYVEELGEGGPWNCAPFTVSGVHRYLFVSGVCLCVCVCAICTTSCPLDFVFDLALLERAGGRTALAPPGSVVSRKNCSALV